MIIQSSKSVLEKIAQLPALPQHIQKIIEIVNQEDADMDEVIRILQMDPSLTSKVLLVANSPLYGLSREVKKVSQAVMVLGLNAIRNLALGISVFQMFKVENNLALKPDEFWKHSLIVACLCRLLAKHLKFKDPENAFTAGLLHDLGKIVMMRYFPSEFSEAVQRARKQEGVLTEMEEEVMGINHNEIGKILCEHWGFPESLTRTTIHHHDVLKLTWPAPIEDQELTLVKMANNLAKLIPMGDSGNPYFENQALQIARLAGLDLTSLQQIFHQLPAELRHLGAFFDLSVEESFIGLNAYSPKVALVLGDHEERNFLSLILSAMGIEAIEYKMNQFEEIRERAVLVDEALIPPYERKVQDEAMIVLNWRHWKTLNPLCMTSGQYHVSSLRHWMSEQLLQESQKIQIDLSLAKSPG